MATESLNEPQNHEINTSISEIYIDSKVQCLICNKEQSISEQEHKCNIRMMIEKITINSTR